MADVIDIHDLSEEDIEFIEEIIELIRSKKISKKKAAGKEASFLKAAGSWKGLVDVEELLKNIYADRQISTRPEVKL